MKKGLDSGKYNEEIREYLTNEAYESVVDCTKKDKMTLWGMWIPA